MTMVCQKQNVYMKMILKKRKPLTESHRERISLATKGIPKTEKAKNNGIIPCYWDNGGNDNNSSGLFNRPSNKIFDRQCVDSLMKGAANGKYPF